MSLPRAIFSSTTLPIYEPIKEPNAKKTTFKGSSLTLVTTIPVVITQTKAIMNCKMAPKTFFPLATTINLKVERAFSIILHTKTAR